MYMRPHPTEIHPGFIRRRCRNPRCAAKLKRETDRSRDAFCCRACFELHYRTACLTCERPMRPKAAQQRFCSNRCRSTFRRHPEQFWSRFTPPSTPLADATRKALGSARKSGLKSGAKPGRAWRVIAGPVPPDINLQVALDPETAAGNRRANHRYQVEATLIGPRDWPIDLIGGGNLQREFVRHPPQTRRKRP
jgi:hypothetical protein